MIFIHELLYMATSILTHEAKNFYHPGVTISNCLNLLLYIYILMQHQYRVLYKIPIAAFGIFLIYYSKLANRISISLVHFIYASDWLKNFDSIWLFYQLGMSDLTTGGTIVTDTCYLVTTLLPTSNRC